MNIRERLDISSMYDEKGLDKLANNVIQDVKKPC